MEKNEFIFKVELSPYWIGLKSKLYFPNGWGISIILSRYSYGWSELKWEAAILYNDGLDYSNPLTNDVIGYQTISEIKNLVKIIKTWEPK